MKQKAILFHPAIAPYRVDFFNSLNDQFDATFYFEFGNVLEQSFEQERLVSRLTFVPNYLKPGFLGIKNLRLQVLSILFKSRPEMIFCSEFNLMGILILLYKYLFDRKVKIFTICDDSRTIAASYSFVKKLLRAFLIKRYSGIILPSSDTVRWYRAHFPTPDKFLFFPIIQKDEPFREVLISALPQSRELFEADHWREKKIVLYVGRLIDIKNLEFLIKCFAANAVKHPTACLLFVGEGEKRLALLDLSKRLGIEDRVVFVGKKQGEDLLAYYNIGQIFVLPSYYERFGAVVNEALLAGCKVLCSKVAGASCLIDGHNGSIFDPYDEGDLDRQLDFELSECDSLKQVDIKNSLMPKRYEEYMDALLNRMCL